ncbi:hypothetical protein V757_07375 [Pelistega indica]|uniref:Uncharacterized protein n=1 Tax=Pelistega indica TaxID=1414851 RepID=V8G3Y2_9BURK|nr:hypothetical protein [Pelistega indica]ETD70806.1 hypothetical protein V757_07375 [Pelistega indica]
MKMSQYTDSQVMVILKQAQTDMPVCVRFVPSMLEQIIEWRGARQVYALTV